LGRFSGIVFNAETNSGKFTVEIATNASAGPHLIRVFNEQGASGPRFLIVTREPQAAEREPNDDFSKPQLVDHLPLSLNGRLDKSGDVDSFAVAWKPGRRSSHPSKPTPLASPVDTVLRLVDSRGVQIALNHDDGRTLDPFLAWTAKTAGTYVLQVFGFAYPATADVNYTGGAACVYRCTSHADRIWVTHCRSGCSGASGRRCAFSAGTWDRTCDASSSSTARVCRRTNGKRCCKSRELRTR
jgi:hypothetical protein